MKIINKFSLITLVIMFFAMAVSSFSGVTYKILNSNTKELRLKIYINIDEIKTLTTTNGFEIILPDIKGLSLIDNNTQGSPLSLEYRLPLSVPSENGFKLKEFKVLKSKILNGIIAPNPTFITKDGFTYTDYILNEKSYNSHENNYDNLKVVYMGLAGYSPLASIVLNPINYDNSKKNIQIIEEIEVCISFNSTGANASDRKGRIPETINSKDVPNWSQMQIINLKNKNENKLQAGESNNWVKITIDKEGIYSITASMLSSLGINISSDKVNTIKIYGYGGDELSETVSNGLLADLPEQEIIVNTNNDGSINNILFYASPASGFSLKSNDITHYINHYSNQNYYLLSWDGEPGRRAIETEPPIGDVVNAPDTYIHRIFSEEELNMPWNTGTGRQWFGRTIFPYSAVNHFHNLDRSDTIRYKLYLAHTLTDTGNYGIFKISENNILTKTCTIYGTTADALRAYFEVKAPASNVADDNISNLKIEYSTAKNSSSATPFIDWYEIHYPRSFAAIDNELSYITAFDNPGITEFTMNNFNGNVYGWDVSDLSSPKLMKNLSHTGSIYICRKDIKYGQVNRLFVSSNIRTPAIERISLANLRANINTADIIVITHRDLAESAQKYVDYRNSQSDMTARLVFVDDIFNEFACGIPDPTAIRNFIQYQYHNSEHKPKYILLWGDGHYDYKNISSNAKNFITTYQTLDDNIDTFNSLNSFTSDDYYARISGNDLIVDIPVGRLPVNSNQEGDDILNKIKTYESSSSVDSWRATITLLSDDSWKGVANGDFSQHTASNENLYKGYLPIDMNINKIYLVNYPVEYSGSNRRKPKVTEDLVALANTAGTNLISYFGHGNPRVLTHEEVFDRDKTVSLFENSNKLFFLTGATCDFARFDNPEVQSGAEELVKYPYGGAIGVFAATRSIGTGYTDSFVYEFYSYLFKVDKNTNKLYRLGDAVVSAKQTNTYNDHIKYNLLGDPSIKLNIPDKIVVIDTVNSICTATVTDTLNLKGLNKVNVKGRILNIDSSFDSGFNGVGMLDMWDASEKVSAVDYYDGAIHTFDKIGNALNKTSVKIVNGEYSGEFYIPKDISYASGLAKISIYAYDTISYTFAKGAWNKINVSGLDETTTIEDNGPQINLFLDSREFKSGDLVCDSPLLIADIIDDTGINTTGAGIGHKIEAWIDENKNIDLTQNFQCNTENPKAGYIEKILYDLSAGMHTIKVRAWDVFNNYSVSFIDFRIANEKDGIIISNTFISPNPTTGEGNIHVFHNASSAYTITIDVYNQAGSLVKSYSREMTDIYKSIIPISGNDDYNNIMPQGAYYYSVRIETKDKSGIGYGSFIIVK